MAKANFAKAKIDLERRQTLVENGSVSGDELTVAETAFKNAEANLGVAQAALDAASAGLDAAKGQQMANAAMIEGRRRKTIRKYWSPRPARSGSGQPCPHDHSRTGRWCCVHAPRAGG